MDAWRAMIAAQGGDPDAPLPRRRETHVVTRRPAGVLTRLDALAVGVAAWRLGAGRARKEDPVQPPPASTCTPSPATRSRAGQPLLHPAHRHPERFDLALADLTDAVTVAPEGSSRPNAPW